MEAVVEVCLGCSLLLGTCARSGSLQGKQQLINGSLKMSLAYSHIVYLRVFTECLLLGSSINKW